MCKRDSGEFNPHLANKLFLFTQKKTKSIGFLLRIRLDIKKQNGEQEYLNTRLSLNTLIYYTYRLNILTFLKYKISFSSFVYLLNDGYTFLAAWLMLVKPNQPFHLRT